MPTHASAGNSTFQADVLIVGCGYLGQRVAERMAARGRKVAAVTRSTARAATFSARGWHAIVSDLSRSRLAEPIDARQVLFSMGKDRGDMRDHSDVWQAAWHHLRHSMVRPPQRLVYISTTGVYGGRGGEAKVDESTPPAPTRPSAKAHLEIEQRLQVESVASWTMILRLGGLYSRERLPLLDRMRAGRPLVVDPDRWLNLIHGDDAASVTVAALEEWLTPGITVVTEGRPITRRDFYTLAARRCGLPPPRFRKPPPEEVKRPGGNVTIRSQYFQERIEPHLQASWTLR